MYKEKVEFLTKQARNLDPYFEMVNSKKLIWELKDELDEFIDAYNNNDFDEQEKELWDVFWVFELLLQKLEEEGNINIEDIYKKIYKKMSCRKSFLEEWKKVSAQEAKYIWNKAKKAEWYSDDRLWTEERTRCE